MTPPRPTPKHARHDDWLDEHGAEELNERPGRRAAFTAGPPKRVSKPDSFEPGGTAPRKPADAFAAPGPTKSASSQQIHQRSASKSSGQMPAPSPTKIDLAVALLRSELAAGERAAVEVEAKALCAGIAPRTYDRARKRLGITSRRIGFGRSAKYVIALPVVDGTPSKGANLAGAA